MFLNLGFEKLLRTKLQRWADDILTTACLEDAFNMFDTRVKCQFNPLSRNCEADYRIPLPGAPSLPHIGLDGGYLRLSRLFHFWIMLMQKRDRQRFQTNIFSDCRTCERAIKEFQKSHEQSWGQSLLFAFVTHQ